jgi:hypothetical protein
VIDTRRCPVDAKPGDMITVETEAVGQPERQGEILEIVEGTIGVSYRVRWNDGHESLLQPAAGSVRVVPRGS